MYPGWSQPRKRGDIPDRLAGIDCRKDRVCQVKVRLLDPSASGLTTPEAMRAAVEQAGSRVIEQTDFTAEVAKRGEPPRQANDVVMGDDFEVRRANVMAGLREQRLVDQIIVAEKP